MEPHSPNFNQPPVSPEKREAYPLSSFEDNQGLNEAERSQSQEILHDSESHEKAKTPSQPAPNNLPAIQVQTDGDSTIPTSLPDPITSTVANDDDVMEKVWVAKSKKIIESTKGDPYEREKEVGKLQAEYIQNRYGKKIKLPGDA